jgi:hypothetical protein
VLEQGCANQHQIHTTQVEMRQFLSNHKSGCKKKQFSSPIGTALHQGVIESAEGMLIIYDKKPKKSQK